MANTGDSHQDMKVLLSNTDEAFWQQHLVEEEMETAGGTPGFKGALVLFWSVFFEQTAPFKDISKLAVNSNSIECETIVGVNMGPFHPFYPCRSISLVLLFLVCIYYQLWELSWIWITLVMLFLMTVSSILIYWA